MLNMTPKVQPKQVAVRIAMALSVCLFMAPGLGLLSWSIDALSTTPDSRGAAIVLALSSISIVFGFLSMISLIDRLENLKS